MCLENATPTVALATKENFTLELGIAARKTNRLFMRGLDKSECAEAAAAAAAAVFRELRIERQVNGTMADRRRLTSRND